MQVTNKRPARKPPTVTHGQCRIVCGDMDRLADFLANGSAILSIRPAKNWKDYWVQTLNDERGRLVGYRLETLVGGTEIKPEVHDIDVSFGGGSRYWYCTCGSDTFDRPRSGVACKHVRAVAAALARPGEMVEF